MEKRPKVGVGVMVVKDRKVLMLKRQGSHGAATWCFPGGHLEFNESWKDCAIRETKEEAGIDIGNISFLTATNDIFHDEAKHYITIFMKADLLSGEPNIMEPEKCTEIGWFSWDCLPRPLFIPMQNLVDSGIDPFEEE